MIRIRVLAAALLAMGVGWQSVMGEVRVGGEAWGAALVALGLLGAVWSMSDLRWRRALPLGAGLMLATGLGAIALVDLFARIQEVPPLTRALVWAVRLVGLEATVHDGRLMAHVDTDLLDWRPTLPRLAAFPFVIVAVGYGFLAVLVPMAGRLRWLGWSLAALAGAFLLRGVVLASVRASLPETGVETGAAFIFLTTLPFVLLAARPVHAGVAEEGRARLQPVLLATFAALSVIGLKFADGGAPGQGRVLFADTHGRWEPTDLPFDTENFGRRNAYSFGNLYDLLGRYFAIERLTEGPLTPALLASHDVLILKTPTQPYQPAEIDAVEQFVEAGGGLLLIGDHTDLFGMSSFMNQLSGRFGIRFRADDTFSLADEGPSTWERPALMPHPIVAGIESFDFETSCSLEVPPRARIVMAGHALGAEMADYNNPGFFGNIHVDLRDRFGFFTQVAALDHGEGRVVAFADSTPFSNFSLFFPGRWELAVSSVDWLNHAPGSMTWLGDAAKVAAAAAFVLLLLTRPGPVTIGVLALWGGAALGLGAVALARPEASLPEPHTRVPIVAFDRGISGGVYPPSLNTDPAINNVAFDTLFTTAQRLGYQPMMAADLAEAMERGDMVVILHPDRIPDQEMRNQLMAFVSNGGSILVADSLVNRTSEANALVESFGLRLEIEARDVMPERVIPDASAAPQRLSRPVQAVLGGYPVLVDPEGRALYAEAEVGNGTVGVLAETLALTRGGLGNRFYDTPNAEQQERYNVAFMVLERGVAGGDDLRFGLPGESRPKRPGAGSGPAE